MKDDRLVAAILTAAFYIGRGASMGLPQIVATYDELHRLLEEQESRKRKKKG